MWETFTWQIAVQIITAVSAAVAAVVSYYAKKEVTQVKNNTDAIVKLYGINATQTYDIKGLKGDK